LIRCGSIRCRRADGPGADFRVAFQITLRRQRVSIPAADPYGPFYPYGMGFGYGRYPGYYGAWNMPGLIGKNTKPAA
jgi:hypothetical protein